MKEVKYATMDMLETLVDKAEKAEKNQYPDMHKINNTINELDMDFETVRFPVVMSLDHNEIEARAVFSIPNPDGTMGQFLLDMEYEDFNKLPSKKLSEPS